MHLIASDVFTNRDIAEILALGVVYFLQNRNRRAIDKNTAITQTVQMQGNSLMETQLRQRLFLAEQSLSDTPGRDANEAEVHAARAALDAHLRMQKKIDDIQAGKPK
jgi:hypothetical protein